ncbi:WASH complex subunit strumpellin [Fopius arisanus]|uniref:STRUM protein n=1 Tax=Fopius arisanus TaxID=64838 RepID=A0A0C9RLI5_9HYME|nr:PREDICTED: WASH complex subunit strumpellin [Fopius arisanus]
MGDFLAINNTCGQNLLRLVSRGNAIIAELMRLKEYVPPIFRLGTKAHVNKYGSIIMDFAYFKAANVHEQRIENDSNLQELDENLRENYSDVLTRFYLAFESIHKYVTDLNTYLDELEDGTYIQQSMETVLLNDEGKQLMCESVYLYGVMLLLVDHQFEGHIREKLLVSYYRYHAQRSSSTGVDDVCMLLRSTGFTKSSLKRPSNYPEDYFKRVPINSSCIDLLIGRLRSDDLYTQTLAFPSPEHRSIASANQAAILVVILLFQPSILHTGSAVMREIVDHFFPDNWVISIYMGLVINLCDWWLPYKAARTALNNTLEASNIKTLSQLYGKRMKKSTIETEKLQLAVSVEENEIESVVKLIREANVSLHWILLHTTTPTILPEESKRARTLRQQVINESTYTSEDSLRLLLSTAQIEQDLKQMYKQLLQDKESKWLENKKSCVERIKDLGEVFSGKRRLDGIETNECLELWFKEISGHVSSLEQEDLRKIAQLLQALEEVQEFHQLENNLQVSQYLTSTREILHSMIRTGSITEDNMIALNIMTDCCYAWTIMESFVETIQSSIKKNPPTVIKLKALFLKMASALETPLLRVNQARSGDLASVSQYYSRELESYARRVLQIIPETVFGLLAQIVHLETNIFKEIPTRLYKDKLKDYAQLEERLQMAKLTYAVSVFTNGVLSLRSVSLGVLRVDSHRLLEDGIRQELIKKVTLALHNGLTFDSKKNSLVSKLEELTNVMEGYRKSFQYIQDYININSLKIWHEEITYIIHVALEDECKDSWIPGRNWKVFMHEEKSENSSHEGNGSSFMGRLARELLRITDPKSTIYVEHSLAWYDLKSQVEVLDHRVFSMILKAIGTPGLFGLDKLLSHYTYVELGNLYRHVEQLRRDKSWGNLLEECRGIISNSESSRSNPPRIYSLVTNTVGKILPQMIESLLKIGHFQLLRSKIAYELNTACKFEAKHMEAALRTFNSALLFELGKKGDKEITRAEENKLINELSVRLDWAGISDHLNKTYINFPEGGDLDIIIFLFTISCLHKLNYCKNTASLLSKKIQDPVDAVVFTIGVHSFLRQFDADVLESYISFLCKYLMAFVASDGGKMGSEWEAEGSTVLHYLQLLSKYACIKKSTIMNHIPVIVLDQYKKVK